tara:strand:- start:664 stop:948 length:285 start_codon:yes stop_codon:yes gene_type:complete
MNWKTLKNLFRRKKISDKKPVLNDADNMVMVRTDKNKIMIICRSEEQMDSVVKRMTTDRCKLAGYEEWDEGEDKKWILSFAVAPHDYELRPELN